MHKIAENNDDYNTIRNLTVEILGEEEFNRMVDDAENYTGRMVITMTSLTTKKRWYVIEAFRSRPQTRFFAERAPRR